MFTRENKTRFSFMLYIIMAAVIFMMAAPYVYGMENGAYQLNVSVSYENPKTGKTADGGTNIELGNSMCQSIVEKKALVEKVDDKYYVTVGLGLMSNVSNVRINVEQSNEVFKNVDITKTGSCTRDDDTCNHYRFVVSSLDKLISPKIYVEPMGRDVQFFIKLNKNSMKKGNGNFVSKMVTSQKDDNKKNIIKKKSDKEDANKKISAEKKEKIETKKESKNNYTTYALVVGIVIIGGGIVGYVLYKRKKK